MRRSFASAGAARLRYNPPALLIAAGGWTVNVLFTSVEAAPFAALLDVREQKRKPGEVNGRELYGQYLRGVEALVSAVDRLAK